MSEDPQVEEHDRAVKIATVALHRAQAGDLPGAADYVKRLNGSNGLVTAIVAWIDTYIARIYPEHKPGQPLAIRWLYTPTGQIESADEVSPAMRWAGRRHRLMMTKAERTELRSLIRQRFKLLRSEVGQRQAELEAELEVGITQRFAADDKTWSEAVYLIEEATREANRKANDIMRTLNPDWPTAHDKMLVGTVAFNQPKQDRNRLRVEGHKRIEAQVKAANLKLDQQEADLLTRLALGALESTEARQFLGEIPTVSSLVPAVRLLELEQSLGGES